MSNFAPNFAIVCSGQGNLSADTLAFSKLQQEGVEVVEIFSSIFSSNLYAEIGELSHHGLNSLSQPLAVASAIANWCNLKEDLPIPMMFAGYSVGEVSAWGCATSLSIEQIAQIAYKRSFLMDQYAPPNSGMLAVRGIDLAKLNQLLNGGLIYVSIINEDTHFVVGGNKDGLRKLAEELTTSGVWSKLLDVSVPSHTPLMLKASSEMNIYLQNSFSTTAVSCNSPVLLGINGARCTNFAVGMDSLARAIAEPIYWQHAMQTLSDSGIKVVLELGPGGSLAKMITEAHPHIAARSIADFRTPKGVVDWVLRQLNEE